MRIRALIFDFDDTIVDSERANTDLLREFFRSQFSVTLTPEDEEGTWFYSWKDTFPLLLRRFAIPMEGEEVLARFMAAKERFLSTHTLRLARGALRMLSLAVPKALVSGSLRSEIAGMMANAGLDPGTFAVTVSAEDVKRCKPDPEGFQRALDLLGAAPGESLVFEDSPIGIQAAKACGIPVAFVREFARRDSCPEADMCFDTLEEAFPWVRERMEPAAGKRGDRK